MTKHMIVGVDIRDLKIAATGARTYLDELCREFRRLNDDAVSFVFFDTALPVYTGKHPFFKIAEHINYFVWKQVTLPLKALWHKCDIIFCTDYFVPLIHPGCKTVPVFHDAFFFEYPGHYNRLWLQLFHMLAVPGARRSPFVITPSDYAKQTVSHFTRITPEKVISIYEAPKTASAPGTVSSALTDRMDKGKAQGLQYILHVGSFDKRKNLPLLVKAFKQLRNEGYTHLRLLLVGKPTPKKNVDAIDEVSDAIRESQLADYVELPGYVADSELPAIYSRSLLYVFPSLNEGFGLPVVECFLHKVPVLVANNTCLPEIGGDAVIGFNPFDAAELAGKMKTLIDNPAICQDLVQKGTDRLQLFSWESAAQSLVDVFKAITSQKA
jgi:glycosyltransferase involved in cell wall biosynthesis